MASERDEDGWAVPIQPPPGVHVELLFARLVGGPAGVLFARGESGEHGARLTPDDLRRAARVLLDAADALEAAGAPPPSEGATIRP